MAAQVIIYDLAGRISVQGADVASKELGKVHKAAAEVKKTLKGVGEAGAHLGHAAMGIAVLGIGAAGVLGKMAHSAMEFEQKMAYVGALVGGKNTDDFKKFELAARSAGITTFASSSKAAEAIYAIRKAGFSTADTIATLNPVLALSTLENIKVEEAAHSAASMTRAFGLEAKHTGDMVDAMAFVSKNTSASIKDLSHGMTYSATTARLLKIDYRDVLTMLGMLNNAGMKGSTAGTTLNAAMLRLAGASVRGTKAIKALGINLLDLNGQTKTAPVLLNEMLIKYQDMDKKFGTVGATKKWMLALGLVGGKFPAALHEMMAYKDLLPKLSGGLKTETDAQRTHSFALQLAQRRYESTLGTVELLGNAFSTFSIELSKANLFGGVFGDKLHTILGVMRLAAASVGDYKIGDRNKIMGLFGLSEDTASKVDKVVAGIKRGVSEAVKYAENMYTKATGMLKKQGQGANIEQIAATATKVVIAVAAIGPAIFAAIPVIWALTGAIRALFAAGKVLSGPGLGIIGLGAGMTAMAGSVADADGKSRGFFGNFTAGLRESNGLAKTLLSSVFDIAKFLGIGGTIATVGALKTSASWVGKALNAASTVTPGAGGAVAGALGGVLSQGLPVEVVKWSAGLLPLPTSGGIPGIPGAPAVPGAAAIPGAVGFNLGTVGGIVIAGTVGYIAGHALDEKYGISDKLSGTGKGENGGGGPLQILSAVLGMQHWNMTGAAKFFDRTLGFSHKTREEQSKIDDETARRESFSKRAKEGQAALLLDNTVNDPIYNNRFELPVGGTRGGQIATETKTELAKLYGQLADLNKHWTEPKGIGERKAQEEKESELKLMITALNAKLQYLGESTTNVTIPVNLNVDGSIFTTIIEKQIARNGERTGSRPEGGSPNQSTTGP